MAVSRNIFSPGITGEITPTSGSFEVVERIAWADTIPRLREIFPISTSSVIGLPEVDPFFGTYRASSVKMRAHGGEPKQIGRNIGFTAGVQIPVYDHNIFTITYSSNQNDYTDSSEQSNDPVPFLSHSWSAGGEIITVENADMKWSGGDAARAHAAASNANFIVPTIEHSITWHRVKTPPFEAIRSALGKVNVSTMDFDTGTNIWPETLLFLGAELSRDILTDGTRAWQVVYKFSERRVDTGYASNGVQYFDGVGRYIESSIRYTPGSITAPGLDDSGLPFGTNIIGGWNHFFRQKYGSTAGAIYTYPGFYRLHLDSGVGLTPTTSKFYVKEFAIFKRHELLDLFTQVT